MKQSPTDTKLKLTKASDAPRRMKTILRGLFESLGIKAPNELHIVLASRVAELTILSEELSNQLITGKPISVEVIGRNADRLQRTLNELRKNAPPRAWHLGDADDEDNGNRTRILRGFVER